VILETGILLPVLETSLRFARCVFIFTTAALLTRLDFEMRSASDTLVAEAFSLAEVDFTEDDAEDFFKVLT
jgi:hypothetical protein